MKFTKNIWKRALSLLIAFMMCSNMMPVSAYASEGSPPEGTNESITEQVSAPAEESGGDVSADTDSTDEASDENAAPGEGANPDENAAPGEGANPDENAAPDEGTNPDENAAPSEGMNPDENAAPGEGATPDENAAPGEGTTPDENAAPDEGTNSDESAAPGENANPDESAVPGGDANLNENTDPAEGELPVEPETVIPPVENAEVSEPSVPADDESINADDDDDDDDDDSAPAETEKVETGKPEISAPVPVPEPVAEPEVLPAEQEAPAETDEQPEPEAKASISTSSVAPAMSKAKFAAAPAAEPVPAAAPAPAETVVQETAPAAPSLFTTVADAAKNVAKTLVKTWDELKAFITGERTAENVDENGFQQIQLDDDIGQTDNAALQLGQGATSQSPIKISLDLNGFKIDLTNTIVVRGQLKISDSSNGNGSVVMKGNADQCVLVGRYGEFTLDSGKITGTKENKNIGVESWGKFTMNGGEISGFGNGGVRVEDNGSTRKGQFTMNDGTITNNTKNSNTDSTLDPETEAFRHRNGAGVEVYGGTFEMNGGTISNNQLNWMSHKDENGKETSFGVSGGGAGVAVVNGGTFTMNDGTITNNTVKHDTDANSRRPSNVNEAAANGGGGVYVGGANSTFTMKDGTISHNNSDTEGGGVFVNEGAKFTMEDGSITYNHANTGNVTVGKDSTMPAGHGGGVFVHGVNKVTTFLFRGGEISHNEASVGGGIFIDSNRKGSGTDKQEKTNFIMGSPVGGGKPVVANNTATVGEGGGIYINSYSTGGKDAEKGNHIYSGDITGNKTKTTQDLGGGGIYVNDSAYLHMQNVIVTKNTANGLGGGLAACVHGKTYISAEKGLAMFDNILNHANGIATSGGHTVWGTEPNGGKIDGHTIWKDDPEFKALLDKALDIFIAGSYQNDESSGALFSNTALGGYKANWTGWSYDNDGAGNASAKHEITPENDLIFAQRLLGMMSQMSEEDKKEYLEDWYHRTSGRVWISENESNVHGGGIGNNGTLVIGEIPSGDLETTGGVNLDLEKFLQDSEGGSLDVKEGQFAFDLYDENDKTCDFIESKTNDADGKVNFRIDGEKLSGLTFDDNGKATLTYYVMERDLSKVDGQSGILGSGLGYNNSDITFDGTVYKVIIEVTKKEYEDFLTLGNKLTNYSGKVTSIEVVEGGNLPDGTKEYGTDKYGNVIDKDNHVVENPFKFTNTVNTFGFELSKVVDGATFTNDDGQTLKFEDGKWTIVDKDGKPANEWKNGGQKVTIDENGVVSGLEDASLVDQYGNTISVKGNDLSIKASNDLKFQLYCEKNGEKLYFTTDGTFKTEKELGEDFAAKTNLSLDDAGKLKTNQSLLKSQVFYLKEVSAPKGYEIDERIHVFATDKNNVLNDFEESKLNDLKDAYAAAEKALEDSEHYKAIQDIRDLADQENGKLQDALGKYNSLKESLQDVFDAEAAMNTKQSEYDEQKKLLDEKVKELGLTELLEKWEKDYKADYDDVSGQMADFEARRAAYEALADKNTEEARKELAELEAFEARVAKFNSDECPLNEILKIRKENPDFVKLEEAVNALLNGEDGLLKLKKDFEDLSAGKNDDIERLNTLKGQIEAYTNTLKGYKGQYAKLNASLELLLLERDHAKKALQEALENPGYSIWNLDEQLLVADKNATFNIAFQNRVPVASGSIDATFDGATVGGIGNASAGGSFGTFGASAIDFGAPNPPTTPPETPENPPETPDTPDEPDTPDTPDEPDTPDTPDEPDTPETPDVPDEPTPLSELPEEEPPLAEMPEEETPLTELPEEEVPLAELPENPIPLAAVPQTGDASMIWLYLALLIAGGSLMILRKKEESEG